MYDYLEGLIASKGPMRVVLDLQGQGFLLEVDARTIADLPAVGQRARLYTLLKPTEDALRLFGFRDAYEREVYGALTAIAGIGPSHALSLLSAFEPAELFDLAARGELKQLSKKKGIGPKLAQRLCVELAASKLAGGARLTALPGKGPAQPAAPRGPADDAVAALSVLGYSEEQAHDAVKRAIERVGSSAGTDILIREALRGGS